MINTIKVYPHTYMDRAEGDHFKAFHIAESYSSREL